MMPDLCLLQLACRMPIPHKIAWSADQVPDSPDEGFLHAAPDDMDSYNTWEGGDAVEPEKLDEFQAELQHAVEHAARRAQQRKAQQAAKRCA